MIFFQKTTEEVFGRRNFSFHALWFRTYDSLPLHISSCLSCPVYVEQLWSYDDLWMFMLHTLFKSASNSRESVHFPTSWWTKMKPIHWLNGWCYSVIESYTSPPPAHTLKLEHQISAKKRALGTNWTPQMPPFDDCHFTFRWATLFFIPPTWRHTEDLLNTFEGNQLRNPLKT